MYHVCVLMGCHVVFCFVYRAIYCTWCLVGVALFKTAERERERERETERVSE